MVEVLARELSRTGRCNFGAPPDAAPRPEDPAVVRGLAEFERSIGLYVNETAIRYEYVDCS